MLELVDRDVGCADQRIAFLVRNDEHNPIVGILQNIRVRFGMHLRHDDVAALDVTHVGLHRLRRDAVQHVLDPGPARVHERARNDLFGFAIIGLQRCAPDAFVTTGADEPCAHADTRAQRLCVDGIDDDEPCVVDARIGVDETAVEPRLETCTPATAGEAHAE